MVKVSRSFRLCSLALALGLGGVLSLGSRRSLPTFAKTQQELSPPCPLGPYSCKQLRDVQVEEQINPYGGWYLFYAYEREKENVEFYAVSAPGFSQKDPSACLRWQGWTVLRNRSREVLTGGGSLPAREYVLEPANSQPPQTMCAIGLWRWGDRFTNNPVAARLYALIDDLFYSQPRLVSIQLSKTITGRDEGCFLPLENFLEHWVPE